MPTHAPPAPARTPHRSARWILLVALLLTVVSAPLAMRIGRTTDLLSVLPTEDAEVATFLEIGARFNLTRAAVIGFEVHSSDDADLFTVPRLAALRSLAQALVKSPDVASVTAFTELMDASVGDGEDGGGERTVVQPLVGELPADPAAPLDDIRQRVLGRPHLRGSLVSNDGRSTIVVVVPKQGAAFAPMLRAEVGRMPPVSLDTHFIGLPFIDEHVADSSAADAMRLGPALFGVLLVALLLSTRSARATALSITAGSMPIVWTLGLFGAMNGMLDAVSAMAPLLLLVVGATVAATSVERARLVGDAADMRWMRRSARRVGLPSLALAASPFIGMLGTGVVPLRALAVLTIVGCVAVLLSLLVVLPAAHELLRPEPWPEHRPPERRFPLSGWMLPAVAAPVLVLPFFLSSSPLYVHGGDPLPLRLSLAELLGRQSEAARGENFLERRFGGALYLQVEIAGDVNHPLVLRQIERLADEVRPLFADVRSVADALKVASRSLTGEARVPASERTTRALTALLAMEPDLKLLIADDFTRTILQLRLPLSRSSEAFVLAARVRTLAERMLGPRVAISRDRLTDLQRALEREEIAAHLSALTGGQVPIARLQDALSTPAPAPDVKRIAERLRVDIEQNELIYLAPDKSIDALAQAIVERRAALGALIESFADPKELGDRDAFADAVRKLGENLDGVARAAATGAVVAAVNALAPALPAETIGAAVAPLNDPYAALPAGAAEGQAAVMHATASARVTGHPLVLARQAEALRATSAKAGVTASALCLMLGLFFAGGGLGHRIRVAATTTLSAGAAGVAFILGLQLLDVAFDPSLVVGCALAMGIVAASAVNRVRNSLARAEVLTLSVAPVIFVLFASGLPAAATFGLLTAGALLVGAVVTRAIVTPRPHPKRPLPGRESLEP